MGTSEIKTEGEDKRNKIDAAQNVLQTFAIEMQTPILSPPSQNIDELLISCKEELSRSLTPKRKWGAETGTSEIRTEHEDKRKKLDAAQNVLLEPFSREMQIPSLSPQSQNIEGKS
ncbi:hypothetical protein MKW92_053795, partial [Papaver armeniacum]